MVDNVSSDWRKSYHNSGIILQIWKIVLTYRMSPRKSAAAERKTWSPGI